MLISRLSVIISLIGIYFGAIIQHHLYHGFINATGKTKALYGLKHLLYLEYSFIGIFSLILSITSFFYGENKNTLILTSTLSIMSILLLVLDVWKIFL